MASKKRTDGEGSLYQRHAADCSRPTNARGESACKCPWQGVYVVDWRDGKPIRRKVSAKSKTDANRKLRELKEQHAAGTLPVGRAPTVEQWLRVWLEQIAVNRVRATTMQLYRSRVHNRLIPLLGSYRLDRLRPEHVERAWRVLLEERGLAPGSVLVDHRILSRALTVAHQRGLVKANVARLVDAPKKADKEMDVLSPDEARRILEAAAKLKRNGARWSVALSLGLRPGEALGLRWSDVDLDTGTLHVRHALSRVKGSGLVLGEPKSESSKRSIALPDALTRQMKAHRLAQNAERLAAGTAWEDGDYVFTQPNGRPVDPHADGRAWHALCEAAKVRRVRRYTSRHTAATLLLAQGVAPRVVMDILGHTTMQMTARYQHVADDMQREAMKRQGAALWGTS